MSLARLQIKGYLTLTMKWTWEVVHACFECTMPTFMETSRANRAHYDRKAASTEEHNMIECMSVLKDMPVFEEKYARAAEKLINSGNDWRSFFLLSNLDRQLEWVNGL
ncbi:hypothetical protein LguiA_010328 [Lonicera macranthoides]